MRVTGIKLNRLLVFNYITNRKKTIDWIKRYQSNHFDISQKK